ncbi:hypothetical protein BS17DRAFT_818479 [Gyrodon lividus]|nr:hypothetical protein BS17DRAFT_818479 [Gyrodon lividus]
MKDASHRGSPLRDPYRKRKRPASRDRGTHRTVKDADVTHPRVRVPVREHGRTTPPYVEGTLAWPNFHRDEPEHGSYPASVDYSCADGPHTYYSRYPSLRGRDVASHSRRHTEGPQFGSPSLGTHVAGGALRVPPVPFARLPSISPSTRNKLLSVPVETLRGIEATRTRHADEDGLSKEALPPTPVSLALPSLRLPTSPTESTREMPSTNPTRHRHQVSLIHRGHPFTYDLSTLPDDPSGPIILLSTTQSDPGAYLLVSVHYRCTGRPKAACCVLRALLASQDSASNPKKDNTPPSTEETCNSPCPKSFDINKPAFQTAAMRPVLLLLAACELDISRDEPAAPESANHASTAHDLFRAVYGTVNEAIIAGAERPKCRNALGLEFLSNAHCSSSSSSQLHSETPSVPASVLLASEEISAPLQALEKESHDARETQKRLRGKLTNSDDRLGRAETRMRSMESRSRDVLLQLDAVQEENRTLRQRLTEAEQRARDLENGAAGAETRVWGRLKDLLFDRLEEGIRGE